MLSVLAEDFSRSGRGLWEAILLRFSQEGALRSSEGTQRGLKGTMEVCGCFFYRGVRH